MPQDEAYFVGSVPRLVGTDESTGRMGGASGFEHWQTKQSRLLSKEHTFSVMQNFPRDSAQ